MQKKCTSFFRILPCPVGIIAGAMHDFARRGGAPRSFRESDALFASTRRDSETRKEPFQGHQGVTLTFTKREVFSDVLEPLAT